MELQDRTVEVGWMAALWMGGYAVQEAVRRVAVRALSRNTEERMRKKYLYDHCNCTSETQYFSIYYVRG